MKPNHIPLTQGEFDLICQSSNWRIDEIPFNTLNLIPKLVRAHQVIGGFISGSFLQPKNLNGYPSIAGFDILAYEPNPNMSRNESHVNAYHHVIQQINHAAFPYLLRGPFREETLIGHWPTDLNLDCYGRS
jgi:hypothetical protein